MNNLEVQRTEESQNSFEQQDKHDYFKVEPVGETVFRKAISDIDTIYLLGNNIIAKTENKKEEIKIEKTLKSLDLKTLIPIIAGLIEQIITEKEQKKETSKN